MAQITLNAKQVVAVGEIVAKHAEEENDVTITRTYHPDHVEVTITKDAHDFDTWDITRDGEITKR